jgi:hypothetical protein
VKLRSSATAKNADKTLSSSRRIIHFSRTSDAQMMLFSSYQHLNWISPRPVLVITRDRAHSRIFSEHDYEKASDPKELFIVPGAGHVDLYDRVNLIPWDTLTSFFSRSLTSTNEEIEGTRRRRRPGPKKSLQPSCGCAVPG